MNRTYFDASFETVELRGKWHPSDKEPSSHVGEANYELLSLCLYLDGQLPGGCQDERHGPRRTVIWFLKGHKPN